MINLPNDDYFALGLMNSALPKISIVTPTFNQGRFIEQTIDSVLSQQYPHLEYIIIDGGSTDNTVEIIKRYEKHLTYWVTEPDKGQSDAINKGLKHCTGKVFNWLNSDDFLEKDTFNIVGNLFARDKTTLVTGTTRIFNEQDNSSELFKSALCATLAKTIASPCFHQPSTFILTEYAKQFNGVSHLLHYAMDTELYTKYLMELGMEGVVIDDNVFANFRVHQDSKTGNYYNDFINEIASVFYSVAMENNLHSDAEKIALISNHNILSNYKFEYNAAKHTQAFIKSIVGSFIFKYINMWYGNDYKKLQKVKFLLNNFETDFLEEQDKIITEKIMLRMPFKLFIARLGHFFNSEDNKH